MSSFSLSGGVEVLGFISPTDTNDTYAVIDPLYGIDGWRNVNTTNDLNSIPNLRRRAGMIVGVSGGTQYYKLKESPWSGVTDDWEIFSLGSTFTGGTVTGDTIFTNQLSANVFSASTYLNLPLDVFVTGGTYSNGTAVFTNNDGVSFSVNGFYTGGTDVTITGGSYSNGSLILENNSGSDIIINGFYTGESSYVNSLVVGIGLSANTNTGNLSIINTLPDQTITISGGTGIVTGGTYPNFTITNTLPDLNVTLTGGTNIEVTGSYPNFSVNYTGQTEFPYLPLSGGTVTGNTNVNGTFVANTISGATLFGNGSNLTNINNFITTAITLNPSQILTLGSGIELLPVPGSNNYYVIDNIVMEYSFVTTPYIFPTSLAFYLDGCFDSYIDRTLLTSSFNTVCVINGNLRNTYQVGSGSGSVFVKTNRDVLNSNLIIGTQNNDNPTSGDGTLRVKITYKIETFGV